MVTAILIVLGLVAIVAVIGGVSMMFNNDGCFFSWYMGYHAMTAGFQVLGLVVVAILEGLSEASKG